MDKFCRICWNSKRWRQPTGEAIYLETGDSYVAKNGFGHEEWLFNFTWLLSDGYFTNNVAYRYAYLQPIAKYYKKYEGSFFSVLLYTRSPEKRSLLVAQINDLYVPKEDELEWARDKMDEYGWISEMQNDLEILNIDSEQLQDSHPLAIANVRFSPENVYFFDPYLVIDENDPYSKNLRYHPYNWNAFPSTYFPQNDLTPPLNTNDDHDPTRSEKERLKASVESTTYDPYHVRIQNNLFRYLCNKHGRNNVQYEKDFVDIILNNNIFIEVKTCLTVKQCIREALGQLLEYSHYPNDNKAKELWIVGDVKSTDSDVRYLNNLRSRYHLPLKYMRWNWAQNYLDKFI